MDDTLFFSGIGGSGMSGLAIVLAARGARVAGSDRSRDGGRLTDLFAAIEGRGILLYPQDGSGVGPDVRRLIVSAAIESSNPDVLAARQRGIPVSSRAELLAEVFHEGRGIAVGGTSGKSTVTGMIGWIATLAGLDPTIINGGRMKNFLPGLFPANARPGGGEWVVIEADESDGTIRNYRPEIAVVTNISRDHKTIEELIPLFQSFLDQTSGTAILNADCPHTRALRSRGACIRFGTHASADLRAADIVEEGPSVRFRVDGTDLRLHLPGRHSIANALAALAAARAAGVPDATSIEALATFSGIGRRFDLVGASGDVLVYDDFAHNPDKIRATLAASRWGRRRLLFFQPHGYGPTRFLLDGLIDAFAEGMADEDRLFVSEIYYAGGTAERNVSGEEIVRGVRARGRDARFAPSRPEAVEAIAAEARCGDIVIVMGARDDTLTDFCREVLDRIGGRGARKGNGDEHPCPVAASSWPAPRRGARRDGDRSRYRAPGVR